ncbi:hypothetical protein AHF37_02329 [Paragonimus kellicotti]|nr:hypothetical protein AHF37_02329 [Paragonimus kellicotti]
MIFVMDCVHQVEQTDDDGLSYFKLAVVAFWLDSSPSWFRGRLQHRKWCTIQQKIILLQKNIRAYLRNKHERVMYHQALISDQAAIVIQSYWRAYLVRRRLVHEKQAAECIQRWWRGYACRRRIFRMREAIDILQRCCRGFLARNRFAIVRRDFIIREQAVITIQSHWRGYRTRAHLMAERRAAVQIQRFWRGHVCRQRWIRTREAILIIQKQWRVHRAHERFLFMYHQALVSDQAAIVIQSYWRAYLVRRRLTVVLCQVRIRGLLTRRHLCALRAHRTIAAITIQSTVRRWLTARHLSAQLKAVTVIQRWFRAKRDRLQFVRTRKAALIIQRQWRLVLTKRHLAARLIQHCWRACGLQRYLASRRRAAVIIQSHWRGSYLRGQLAKFSSKPHGNRTAVTVKEKCEIPPDFSFDRITAVRLDTIAKVLQSIKDLELFTRLSSEICYWAVGSHPNRDPRAQVESERSPQLHLLLLNLIRACNRSVPHEDILLHVTGTLLNIARHHSIACQVWLWWTTPSAQASHSTWISPALLQRTRARLDRSASLCSLPSSNSLVRPISTADMVRRDQSVDRVDTDILLSPPVEDDSSNSSLAEMLVTILLRTWRSRQGTLGIRLFARTCCLLAILCEAVPTSQLPATSLLSVCSRLSDCISRRSAATQLVTSQWTRGTVVEHSSQLLQQPADRLMLTMSSLRKHLSYELDWHLLPTKVRPDPLIAIDYLLLVIVAHSNVQSV